MSDIKELSNEKERKDTLVKKIKEIEYSAYAHYFYNPEHLESEIFPIVVINPTFILKRTQETFELGKPAYFLKGKPVFILVRDLPFSIELEFSQSKELIKTLKEKGYSAKDINAKLNSIYVNQVFRSKRFNKQDILLFLLSILTSVLITAMCFMMFME